MYRTLLVLLAIFFFHLGLYAQKPPKPVPQSSEMERLMKEAQKELDKLSPEQRAMFDQMMKNQSLQNNGGASGDHFVPPKQSKLLSQLKKLDTREQFDQYISSLLAEARSNIPAGIISQVDALMAKYKGDELAIHNLPMVLFMQEQTPAAIYAGLMGAKGTDRPGTLNNIGSLLNEAGYPQYAIPILDYLVRRHNHAILLNNSGQAYLRLGDTATASQRFMRALKQDDHLAEAHSGIAHIMLEQKRDQEAATHIAKALRDGYSKKLADHVTKNNVTLPFDDLKRKGTGDYFSKQKFNPLGPATTLVGALDNWNKIEEMEVNVEEWSRKSEQLSRDLPVTDEKWQRRLVVNSSRGPYKKKALLMANLMMNNFNDYVASCQRSLLEGDSLIRNARKHMNEAIDYAYKNESFNGPEGECLMIKKHIEKYLDSTAPHQNNAIIRLNSRFFDLVNEEIYWLSFILNRNEFRAQYANIGHHVASWQKSLSSVQRLFPDVVNRGTQCLNTLQNPSGRAEIELAEWQCPITLKFPLVVASLKINCDGWELEGGEGLIINIERAYKKGQKDGQWTFAFGAGWELETGTSESGVGAMAGAKVQIAYVFDEDFNPTDIVVRGEAKGEINTILMQSEGGLKGMISISGTASVDALAGKVNDNNEINIFKQGQK